MITENKYMKPEETNQEETQPRQVKPTKMTSNEMQNLNFEEEIGKTTYEEIKWSPVVNQALIGEYQEKRTRCGVDNYTFYIINDGKHVYSILENTVLKSLFEKIQPGDIIKLTFLGEKQSKRGRKYKDYTIHRARKQ